MRLVSVVLLHLMKMVVSLGNRLRLHLKDGAEAEVDFCLPAEEGGLSSTFDEEPHITQRRLPLIWLTFLFDDVLTGYHFYNPPFSNMCLIS